MSNIFEYANFGFDQYSINKKKNDDGDEPLYPVSVGYVSNLLSRKAYGVKFPIKNNFFGEVQWGNNDGALKASFSPLGGLNVSLRKLIHNLLGEKVWICKKVIEVKNQFDKNPDKLHYVLDEVLTEIDHTALDSPSNTYEHLERLAIKLATTLRSKTTQVIFMYQGVRQIKQYERYIIHFGVTGYGRQKPGQKRLDQMDIDVNYDKHTGMIKICANELGDEIGKHRWQYDPSNFEEYFAPSQSMEEICNAILVHFNCY